MCYLQDISNNVSADLTLKRIAWSSDVDRRLQVLLVGDGSQSVTATGNGEENCNDNQTGDHDSTRDPLDGGHQQVETTSWPVGIEVPYEVGESIS